MRPHSCPDGHPLVWLTDKLAVCPECDDRHFIYHYHGYGDRLLQFSRRLLGHLLPQRTTKWHGYRLV